MEIQEEFLTKKERLLLLKVGDFITYEGDVDRKTWITTRDRFYKTEKSKSKFSIRFKKETGKGIVLRTK